MSKRERLEDCEQRRKEGRRPETGKGKHSQGETGERHRECVRELEGSSSAKERGFVEDHHGSEEQCGGATRDREGFRPEVTGNQTGFHHGVQTSVTRNSCPQKGKACCTYEPS